jgi:hypothetical protein
MDSVFKNIVKIKAHTKQFRIVLLGLINTSSEQEVGLNLIFENKKKQGPTTFTHAVRLLNELTVIAILKITKIETHSASNRYTNKQAKKFALIGYPVRMNPFENYF